MTRGSAAAYRALSNGKEQGDERALRKKKAKHAKSGLMCVWVNNREKQRVDEVKARRSDKPDGGALECFCIYTCLPKKRRGLSVRLGYEKKKQQLWGKPAFLQ